MEAYINGTAVISPQGFFSQSSIPDSFMEFKAINFFKCIEPSYREMIDPMASRRMSRIVKMGVYAAKSCMADASVVIPGAILTGTGLGCIEDTSKFLGSLIVNEEKLLNPTPFIQSTHNTVAAAVALAVKCHNYNSTYVHRGNSFESALLDGLLLLKEKEADNVLVGGLDELTSDSYQITKRLQLWKHDAINSIDLLKSVTKGTIPGEGASFFSLSENKNAGSYAKLKALNTFYKPSDDIEVKNRITDFINVAGLKITDIDLFVLGLNGDVEGDETYKYLMNNLPETLNYAGYKN